MRYSRQNKILEIIAKHEVETQGKLVALLKKHGHDVTQATISRDIKDLQLIKTLSSSGKYRYASATTVQGPVSERLIHVFRETVKSIDCANNLIVVKTLFGCGNAAAEVIDTLDLPHVVGTVAGNNTFLVIVDDTKNTGSIAEQIKELME